jgi:hypothetical protein
MVSPTPEQHAAVDEAIGQVGNARVDDYVVLRAEVYDRVRAALDDRLDMAQVSLLVDAAMQDEDAGDPLLERYQRYRP